MIDSQNRLETIRRKYQDLMVERFGVDWAVPDSDFTIVTAMEKRNMNDVNAGQTMYTGRSNYGPREFNGEYKLTSPLFTETLVNQSVVQVQTLDAAGSPSSNLFFTDRGLADAHAKLLADQGHIILISDVRSVLYRASTMVQHEVKEK